MECLTINEIIKAVDGEGINCTENVKIYGVSTDSRNIRGGDLFIALAGNNFDGHEFVCTAVEKGANAVIVSKAIDCNCPQIVVDNTMTALRNLGKYYRSKFNIPVVAITGSTGKTSTKEMIASVLQEKFNIHKTQKNFNNEIGLPLTIFNLNEDHEISVLEMGMNNFGEIQRLAEIARPSIGVITNIGTAHIENLGSRENILKAKLEVTSFFDENSTLIVNGDDEFLSNLCQKSYRIIKTSISGKGDFNARNIRDLGECGVEFTAPYKGEEHLFKINVPGVHNVYNAMAAIAIADMFNLTAGEVKRGVMNFRPVGSRMNIISLDSNIKIIDDCYNANLESMKAAINVLSSFNENRKIAVLGDMFELGSFSEEAHRQVGRYLKSRCDMLVTVGKDSRYIYEEAKDKLDSKYFDTKEEACLYLKTIIQPRDVVLIKASRGMKMEEITGYLIEDRKRGI